MTQIRGVLFDKDGTLIDFDQSWAPINRAISMIAAHGDEQLAEHFMRIGGMDPHTGKTAPDTPFASGNARDIAERWIEEGAAHEVNQLATIIDQEATRAAVFAVAVTDLKALFQQLKDMGLHLGVASSDSEAGVRALIEHMGLSAHVDFIAGYDSGHGPKPEPGMIHAFAAACGLQPHNIAMVGDNIHDLEMAARAGAGRAIGVLSGTGTHATLSPHAHALLSSIADLPQFLRSALEYNRSLQMESFEGNGYA